MWTEQQLVWGAVAEMAAERKAEKYHNLSSDHTFQPITMENLDAFSLSSLEFLRELERTCGLWAILRSINLLNNNNNNKVGWVVSLEKCERPAFFSSACLLQYIVLIRCFCTMALLMTFRTSSHFSCFYPFCF